MARMKENLAKLQNQRESATKRHKRVLDALVELGRQDVEATSAPDELISNPGGAVARRMAGAVATGGTNAASTEAAVNQLLKAMGGKVKIVSGKRSVARQQQLWNAALKKYGSPERARKWVAPPGRSKHQTGEAYDLGYADAATRALVHKKAAEFGLHFPLAHEPWHVERIGSRGKHKH